MRLKLEQQLETVKQEATEAVQQLADARRQLMAQQSSDKFNVSSDTSNVLTPLKVAIDSALDDHALSFSRPWDAALRVINNVFLFDIADAEQSWCSLQLADV